MTNTVVVDTNVAIVANGRANHIADQRCVGACIDNLRNIVDKGRVAIDDGYRILDEYRRNLSPSGQPGTGDMFFKWVWDNQANVDHVEQVKITPKPDHQDNFQEFPTDNRLRGFHTKDRKFVAVALASRSRPTVLNASDTDWWKYRKVLREFGEVVPLVVGIHAVGDSFIV